MRGHVVCPRVAALRRVLRLVAGAFAVAGAAGAQTATPSTPAPGPASSPSYLVERLATIDGTAQRISVFRDGTAALVRRKPSAEADVVEHRLGVTEQQVMTQVVSECYAELQEYVPEGEDRGSEWVELRLAPPDREPRVIRFPSGSLRSLNAGRLSRALDDLEMELKSDRNRRDDLSTWQPEVGQRLLMEDGRVLEVSELIEASGGVVYHMTVIGAPASQFWSLDELRRRGSRLVQK